MQGNIKKQFGNLTDNDLTVISYEREDMFEFLETKCGHAKGKTEKDRK
jgi:uncharacterized protein YjbJ (UPF0337 family)